VPFQVLAALLWGTVPVQMPVPSPQAHVATQPVRAPESDPVRIQRLQALVEAAEKALEAEDEGTATTRSDEADVLVADWPLELLNQPQVQALLQRLKDLQDQIAAEEPADSEPGLKASEEVVSISGNELRAELERVQAAERGATYDFPIDLNDKVLTWVSLFSTTKRGFIENALGRASQYMPMIRQVFAEEGVPSDLAYLAVIESGFRNEAKSRAKAVGMWQFIQSTGRIYGLTANKWVEERRDPVKATRAAARYLKRLYEITGDWYLATSSYNAGPLTLDRAIQNMGTRNFWDLARSCWLRTETKNYVPELCAAILVGRSPERYGLQIAPLAPYAYETVTVEAMTSLGVLARCAGTDASEIKALNPELLRGSTPPGHYQLRVPPGKAMDCLRQLAHMPTSKRLDFHSYTVRKGDSLAKVARRFDLAPEDLLAANDMTAKQFRPGRHILVPSAEETGGHGDRKQGTRESSGPHRSQPLAQIPLVADDPDRLPEVPPVSHLEAPEKTPVASPQPADAVPVPPASQPETVAPVPSTSTPPGAEAASTTPVRTIRAKRGDTLAKLARAHQVPFSELLHLNPNAAKALHPGDEVRLPGGVEPTAPTAPARFHQVQKGETLASIARRYDLAPRDLQLWNHLRGTRIKVGQRLRLAAR
jgi:membrane-bound lytic murein transglycosylase D